jgi:DNA-binding transcriptional MerR regulator
MSLSNRSNNEECGPASCQAYVKYNLTVPTIEDYLPLAPFSLPELVAAANAILRDRPALQIQPRTVRFYISNGLLPPPSGGPKYARYTIEHLRRVVFIRQWLDQGMSLEQASELIRIGKHGGETETHVRKQNPQSPKPMHSSQTRERANREKIVRRINLTENTVLEIDTRATLEAELELALESLQNEILKLNDTF